MVAKSKLLHARIQNPLLVRKTLLESAISIAEVLKSMRILKKISSEKNKRKTELKKLFDEIRILRTKLEEHELPPLSEIKDEKISKKVQKKELISEEIRKQKQQEKMLSKELEKSSLDFEIDQLKEKIRGL
ncbi:hypothetical protein HYT56_01575 [Candidatus Woesearchaeota archaeon]|nr:hypothetical protein [Candidatus Woesearchaeota archaeon]